MRKVILILFLFVFFISGCNQNSNRKTSSQAKVIAVATYVDNVVLDIIRDSFKDELINLGYTKENGWNIIIKSANGQPGEAVMVAEELLNMKPNVIVSISTPATKPVFDKNMGKIPHVFCFVSFPSTIGITKESINTTGLSDGVDFEATIAFIQKVLPTIKKLGMVYSDEPQAVYAKEEILKQCLKNDIQFIGQTVSKEDEVKQACQSIANKDVNAIIVGADGVVVTQIKAMIEVANSNKIPLFTMDEGTVENGAFAALSVNYNNFGKESAILTDKVIKAGSASNFKLQTYFGKDIVINLKTAQLIGRTFPDSLVVKAYKIIK